PNPARTAPTMPGMSSIGVTGQTLGAVWVGPVRGARLGAVPSLSIDPTELSTCVGCGLCLPHCPTFRATGEEALSPRGRIAAMRAVQDDDAPIDAEFVRFIDTCVQCRGCEPACPSGVPYGHLVEATTTTL